MYAERKEYLGCLQHDYFEEIYGIDPWEICIKNNAFFFFFFDFLIWNQLCAQCFIIFKYELLIWVKILAKLNVEAVVPMVARHYPC